MVDSGSYTAVLDRIEDDLAVLILEEDGEAVEEHVVPLEELPEPAQTQDAILEVTVEDGDIVDAVFDPDKSAERIDDAQSRFDRLARRPPDEDEEMR
jgi:hypothetical protein